MDTTIEILLYCDGDRRTKDKLLRRWTYTVGDFEALYRESGHDTRETERERLPAD